MSSVKSPKRTSFHASTYPLHAEYHIDTLGLSFWPSLTLLCLQTAKHVAHKFFIPWQLHISSSLQSKWHSTRYPQCTLFAHSFLASTTRSV